MKLSGRQVRKEMSRTKQAENFSNNIIWYNFILCILVILIHARNDAVFTAPVWIADIPVFNEIESFLASDVAGAAVGGFYLGSGYLFFRNYSWKKIFSKYRSRIQSLVIPYILWTSLYFFMHVVISRIPALAAIFQDPPIQVTWKSLLDAIIHYRYCAFLWFLQFLIFYVAVSPLIYFFIRNQYSGAAAILMVFFTACTNIIKNEQTAAVTNWMSLYMLGGYIGIHFKEIIETKKADIKILTGASTLTVAAFWIYKRYPSVFGVLFYSLCFSAALWCLIAWERQEEDTKTMPEAGEWQKNTFAVYMTHFLIVQAANVIAGKFISISMWMGVVLFFVLPMVCFGMVYLAKKICGDGKWILWRILMGSR